MAKEKQNLPDFENPPVIEVYFSLQFKDYGDEFVRVFGSFGEVVKNQFPKIQLQNPLAPNEEKFGPVKKPSFNFKITQEPQNPRCWFINKDDDKLIQIQSDRFIFNWRKNKNSEPYPRYKKVFSGFRGNFKKFNGVLKEHGLDKITPQLCEVTYINQIHQGTVWKSHSEFNKIFTVFQNKYSDRFLRDPEEISANLSYKMKNKQGDPFGRLRFKIEPRILVETQEPIFQMSVTARGFPMGRGWAGAERFFEFGREQIVKGFASITTEQMHKQWDRKDD